MIRTLRASRSLPSLRSAAIAHAPQPVPALPNEYCLHGSRTMATAATPRTRKTKATVLNEPITPLIEPKKRGRPRKNTLTPTTHKRSNSTDSKPATRKSKQDESVPTIPQPAAEPVKKTSKARDATTKTAKQESNVPIAADNFQAQAPMPEASGDDQPISTLNPEDLGTRVQAVSSKTASEAQKFAEKAVGAIDSSTNGGVESVQNLLKDALKQVSPSSESNTKDEKKQNKSQSGESKSEDIPQGEKTALLTALGLTGLWVVFGGRFQKKAGPKK